MEPLEIKHLLYPCFLEEFGGEPTPLVLTAAKRYARQVTVESGLYATLLWLPWPKLFNGESVWNGKVRYGVRRKLSVPRGVSLRPATSVRKQGTVTFP